MAINARGYGIAGHVGEYTSKVKCGNWVEDSLAFERIQNPPPVYKNFESECMSSYRQYRSADPADRETIKRQIADLRSKNKDGMSYSTLFEHGNYKQASADRYLTNTQLSMSATRQRFGDRSDVLSSSKWKEIRKEMLDISVRRPETRDANVYLTKHAGNY